MPSTHACGLPLWCVEAVGQDVLKLVCGRDTDYMHVAILDRLVREVLADVDVLGTFTTSDDVVAPFDAASTDQRVFVIHVGRSPLAEAYAVEQVPNVHDFGSGGRSGVILGFANSKSGILLQLRSPHNRSLVQACCTASGCPRQIDEIRYCPSWNRQNRLT